MSRLIFDRKDRSPLLYVDKSEWTNNRVKEEFFLCLARASHNKYYEQAKKIMYRIPLTQQYPKSESDSVPFVIDYSDLSSRVQLEFTEYCRLYNKKQVGLFLKEVVIRIFENLDYDYSHMSIMKKLRVKIEDLELS